MIIKTCLKLVDPKCMIISTWVFTLGDTGGKVDEIADLHPYTRNRTKKLAFPLRRNGGSVFLGMMQ